VGKVYGANTLGSVVGSLLAGFLLIPLLGTQNSLILVAMINGLLGLACALAVGGKGRRGTAGWALASILALTLTLLLLPPNGVIFAAGMFHDDRPEDLVHFHEDAQASVTIRRLESPLGPYLSLELNGVNVAGTSPDLYAVQKMQGHLPLLLGSSVESVAHIGFGSGGTAWAVSQHPVQEIRIIEISPEVIAASHRFFSDINHGVLDDPRVEVEINDGRNHLLATSRTYDAVLSDSIHPRYSGNGSLYSLEYFQRLAQRLSPQGVASMWLPMYSLTPRNYAMILKAFSEVFSYVAVWYEPSAPNSFTIVTGSQDGSTFLSSNLEKTFENPRVARELADLGIEGPAEVVACYLVGGEALRSWLSEIPPHVDDLPAVEYESGTVLLRGWTRLEIFTTLLTLRPDEPPRELVTGLPPHELERARQIYRARKRLLWEHRNQLHGLLLEEVQDQLSAAHRAP
jgi:spermidine synthase